ncbi:hypothetical protein [Catenulispora pinisilvae]|uniref:hypothetical protein n=1 Tax=Catenulispora pinisilvae TaxID=2705253 RepID=UPI0018919F4B|nr:hypothetical protein [Catenulispora pinisilvae]
MSAWTPHPDAVVHDPARGCDGVLLGRAADGTWRLAGLGDERWNTDQIAPAASRPVDEFGHEMPHPLRPWEQPDSGWRQGVVPSAVLV